ncbi:MAG: BrnT family toxin [Treponema sp.]|nr:BrnT family toxin [Treponema sp.]
MEFEWDEEKNSMNIKKHGVGFEEAIAVFLDPLAVELYDREHSNNEERWRAYGFVHEFLAVTFTERNGIRRLFSARKATKTEKEELLWLKG